MESAIYQESRRNFLRNTLITGTFLPLIPESLFAMNDRTPPDRLKIHIFSKHLQFLGYKDLAQAAADMGFDGVDLTVRPNGHVSPERVEDDLPKAVEAFKEAGLHPLLMTNAVGDAANASDKKVLETAARLGFKYYRMNWYAYPEGKGIPESIVDLREKVKGLGSLNKELGLTGCYQNHAGLSIGSNIWEIWELLKDADKEHMGVQYDIRHAMVEGFSSWQNGLRLIRQQIKMLTVKDFRFGQKNGVTVVEDVPIGQGLIDFKGYFKLVKEYGLDVPFTLHIEYPLGGAEHGDRKISIDKQEVFKAMKSDLQKIHRLWQEA